VILALLHGEHSSVLCHISGLLQATNRRNIKKEAILISRFLLPLLAGAVLFAQDPSAHPQPPDLKVFLNLSDSQIQGVVQVQQQKGQALQPVVQQSAQTQQKLQQILAAPNPDPATVGQLVIAIATLGQQVQQIAGSFQQQASNLLQSDQKTKLPPLQLALELQPAARQAVSLGLLNAP
jgi:methyl-accepting chemotaxis protein